MTVHDEYYADGIDGIPKNCEAEMTGAVLTGICGRFRKGDLQHRVLVMAVTMTVVMMTLVLDYNYLESGTPGDVEWWIKQCVRRKSKVRRETRRKEMQCLFLPLSSLPPILRQSNQNGNCELRKALSPKS